jgi:hypothetical protein
MGMILDSKSFTVNLLNSAIDVVLTVTIIDWLLDRQRRRQWNKVRSQIITALTWHIGNIASEYMINFHGSDFDLIAYTEDVGAGYEKPVPRTAKALMSMVEMMEKHSQPDDARSLTEKVYTIIKWDLAQIRDSLIPRVLAMEIDEIELVSAMGNLDNSSRRWANEIVIDEEISSGDQYNAAIEMLRAAANLYQYLVEHAS